MTGFEVIKDAQVKKTEKSLIISSAFKINGRSYDVKIENEGMCEKDAKWPENLLIQRVQAVWKQVFQAIPENNRVGVVSLIYSGNKTSVKAGGKSFEGTELPVNSTVLKEDLGEIEDSLKSVSSGTKTTVHDLTKYLSEHALKPCLVVDTVEYERPSSLSTTAASPSSTPLKFRPPKRRPSPIVIPDSPFSRDSTESEASQTPLSKTPKSGHSSSPEPGTPEVTETEDEKLVKQLERGKTINSMLFQLLGLIKQLTGAP